MPNQITIAKLKIKRKPKVIGDFDALAAFADIGQEIREVIPIKWKNSKPFPLAISGVLAFKAKLDLWMLPVKFVRWIFPPSSERQSSPAMLRVVGKIKYEDSNGKVEYI